MSEESENKVEYFEEHRKPKEIMIRGAGGEAKYTVNEMDGDPLADWMEIIGKRIKTDGKGKTVRSDFKGLHADLISLCLKDAQGNLVSKTTIRHWGAHLQNKLFEMCQEMNGLKDSDKDEEGKD